MRRRFARRVVSETTLRGDPKRSMRSSARWPSMASMPSGATESVSLARRTASSAAAPDCGTGASATLLLEGGEGAGEGGEGGFELHRAVGGRDIHHAARDGVDAAVEQLLGQGVRGGDVDAVEVVQAGEAPGAGEELERGAGLLG